MRKRAAFTLVEVLVVIAIIAALIAVLMPALGKARRQAQATQCASNLRQLYVAQLLYAGDSKGRLTTVDFGGRNTVWPTRLAPYLSKTGQPSDALMHCPSVALEDIEG